MPPPEPTTSPSVNLEAELTRALIEHVSIRPSEDKYVAEIVSAYLEGLLAEVARLQAQVAALVDDCDRSAADAQHWSDVARTQKAQVASMREVVTAAQAYRHAVANDAMRHQASCEDSPCAECDRTVQAEDDALHALFESVARLDASPQPQGDGQALEEDA